MNNNSNNRNTSKPNQDLRPKQPLDLSNDPGLIHPRLPEVPVPRSESLRPNPLKKQNMEADHKKINEFVDVLQRLDKQYLGLPDQSGHFTHFKTDFDLFEKEVNGREFRSFSYWASRREFIKDQIDNYQSNIERLQNIYKEQKAKITESLYYKYALNQDERVREFTEKLDADEKILDGIRVRFEELEQEYFGRLPDHLLQIQRIHHEAEQRVITVEQKASELEEQLQTYYTEHTSIHKKNTELEKKVAELEKQLQGKQTVTLPSALFISIADHERYLVQRETWSNQLWALERQDDSLAVQAASRNPLDKWASIESIQVHRAQIKKTMRDFQKKISKVERLIREYEAANSLHAVAPKGSVRVTFAGNYDQLTEQDIEAKRRELAALAGVEPEDIEIKARRRGSIVLDIELPQKAAARLVALAYVQHPVLRENQIEGVRLLAKEDDKQFKRDLNRAVALLKNLELLESSPDQKLIEDALLATDDPEREQIILRCLYDLMEQESTKGSLHSDS